MKMNRTLILCLSVVLAAALATTGTIAYLSDTDSDVNVMTLGNVKIEQIEMKRAENVPHKATAEEGHLVPFEDGVQLYPAFPKNNQPTDYSAEQTELFYWGPYVTAEGAGNGLWNEDKLIGAVDKFVFVKNTGSAPAYYRTIIAFECPEGMEYSQGWDKEFMMNVNDAQSVKFFDWTAPVDCEYVEIDGVRYLVTIATYKHALKAGETSRPSLLQVVLTHNATNEDMVLLGDTYEILVLSQAVQTTNFESVGASVALNTAFGEPTEEKVVEWFTGIYPETTTVDNAEELENALKEYGQIIYLEDDVDMGLLTTGANVKATIDLQNNALIGTLTNNGDVEIKNGEIESAANAIDNFGKATYTDVTVKAGSPADYALISHAGSETTYNNVALVSAGGGVGAVNGAKVTFNSGSLAVNSTSTSGRYLFYAEGEGSEVTINEGNFSFSKTLNQKRAYIYAASGTTVYVNGGTFGPASTRDGYTAGILGDGTVIITGGTFGFDPSNWVAEGYQAVKNGSTWTVSAK